MSVELDKISLSLELSNTEAWALAQFCKRTTHQDCVNVSTSENEAYEMMDGINAIMRTLAEAGIAPR